MKTMPTPAFPPAWLIEIPGARWTLDDVQAMRRRLPGWFLDVMTAVDQDETWVYAMPLDPAAADASALPVLLLGGGFGAQARVRQLEGLTVLGDAQAGALAPWHYTSQTDIPEHWEAEFNQWFDQDHLPALAGLPDTVCARRYRTNGSPRYLAGYDLLRRDAQGSPEWRAAIDTPWRERVHGRFVNPRRLMLKRVQ